MSRDQSMLAILQTWHDCFMPVRENLIERIFEGFVTGQFFLLQVRISRVEFRVAAIFFG
jgi:hypothetical protein